MVLASIKSAYSLLPGRATYSSCDDPSRVPCTEELNITSGDSVQLNVSLKFVDAGPSALQQDVTRLQLYSVTDSDQLLYMCDLDPLQNENKTCESSNGITVSQPDPDVWYDIVLGMEAEEVGGCVYRADYGAIDPRHGGVVPLTKVFTVTVSNSKYTPGTNADMHLYSL